MRERKKNKHKRKDSPLSAGAFAAMYSSSRAASDSATAEHSSPAALFSSHPSSAPLDTSRSTRSRRRAPTASRSALPPKVSLRLASPPAPRSVLTAVAWPAPAASMRPERRS